MLGFGGGAEVKDKSTFISECVTKNWELWNSGNYEKFANVKFVKDLIEWRNQHSPKSLMGKIKKTSKYLHFGMEIIEDIKPDVLAKPIVKPDNFNAGELFAKIDFENELLIWFQWESDTGFLLTNKAMYCSFSGEKMMDARKRLYVKDCSSLKDIKIKMAMVHANVLINDEQLGTWTISDGKDFLRKLCDSIVNRANESISSTEVAKSNSDIGLDTLKKLKELLDTGIITQEEFDAKKNEIISRI